MELCPGGELLEKLTDNKRKMSENMAAEAIDKIIRALIHTHKENIVHRDIKPENIMYDNQTEVKLIDFGLAKQVVGGKKLHTVAGTPYFIAPEVLNGNYGKECDFWSVGVLLYLLVTGTYPFDSDTKNRTEVFTKIKNGAYKMTDDMRLSPECKDLLKRMICVDRSKRISGEDILKHQWFKNCLHKDSKEVVLDDAVL
jgi:calcium-dependent protein kinase